MKCVWRVQVKIKMGTGHCSQIMLYLQPMRMNSEHIRWFVRHHRVCRQPDDMCLEGLIGHTVQPESLCEGLLHSRAEDLVDPITHDDTGMWKGFLSTSPLLLNVRIYIYLKPEAFIKKDIFVFLWIPVACVFGK